MLGIAASISTMKPMGVPIFDGDISEINTAIPRLIGTAIAIAMAELRRVPMTYGSAPYDSLPATGSNILQKESYSFIGKDGHRTFDHGGLPRVLA